MTDQGIAFAIVPLSGIAFFAVVFALAVANVRNGEVHKRQMLLAGISILDAAVARCSSPSSRRPDPSARRRCRSPSYRLSSLISCW